MNLHAFGIGEALSVVFHTRISLRQMRTRGTAALAATGLLMFFVCSSAPAPTPAAPPEAANGPRQKEVEELIHRYFSAWSNEDLKGYGNCFHKNACVQFIGSKGEIEHKTVPAFLTSQAAVFRASGRQTEVPESIDIRFENDLARAVVRWKLIAAGKTVFGYDHFTLAKKDGKWRVVNLVFYETKVAE
jgi:pyroglutamyl-peptidase